MILVDPRYGKKVGKMMKKKNEKQKGVVTSGTFFGYLSKFLKVNLINNNKKIRSEPGTRVVANDRL